MQDTDPYHLYDPLKNTLDRSSAHWNSYHGKSFQKATPMNRSLYLSKVSKKCRELSPRQAHEIKQSTLIPVDKDLIPTNNFQRIHGKQFSVVGIQVKEGNPIPFQQFHKQYKRGPLHQQTIYELQPKNSSLLKIQSPIKSQYKIQSPTTTNRTNITNQYKTKEATSLVSLSLKKSTHQPKKPYKYNLFSALDEAVNSNCSSCGGNEIIATKQYSNWQ